MVLDRKIHHPRCPPAANNWLSASPDEWHAGVWQVGHCQQHSLQSSVDLLEPRRRCLQRVLDDATSAMTASISAGRLRLAT